MNARRKGIAEQREQSRDSCRGVYTIILYVILLSICTPYYMLYYLSYLSISVCVSSSHSNSMISLTEIEEVASSTSSSLLLRGGGGCLLFLLLHCIPFFHPFSFHNLSLNYH